MPTSHYYQLNEIVQVAELLQPMSVLDVGIGNGKYGFLLREFLGGNRGLGWEEFRLDGIEGCESYLTDVHRATYNEILLLDLADNLHLPGRKYDLCILIDIIEHFDREKGLEILDYLSSISGYMVVATPWDIGDPSVKHDNPLEDHKYQWLKKDFRKCPNPRFIYNRDSLIVVMGSDSDKVDSVERKMRGRFYKNIYEFVRRSTGLKKG